MKTDEPTDEIRATIDQTTIDNIKQLQDEKNELESAALQAVEPHLEPLDPAGFLKLVQKREDVLASLAHANSAAEAAKDAKKTYELARVAFEKDFDAYVRRQHGEDLPLFNQTDANAAAAATVTEDTRLLAADLFDLNIIVEPSVIAGWTAEERKTVEDFIAEYDAAVDRNEFLKIHEPDTAEVPLPTPPAILFFKKDAEIPEGGAGHDGGV